MKNKAFALFLGAVLLGLCLNPTNLRAGAIGDYFAAEGPGQGLIPRRNQTPLLNLFYLMQTEGPQTLGQNSFAFRIDFELTNTFERNFNNFYAVNYDQEIYRTSFQFTYGILDNLDFHLEIPTIATNGGFLDGFVQDYHNAFGFPNGERETAPNGVYGYAIFQNGAPLYTPSNTDFDLGDVNMDLKWRVVEEGDLLPAVALRAGIKFATGEFQKGSGSGEVDYSFGFVLHKSFYRFNLYAGLDGIIIEDPVALRGFIDEEILHYFGGLEFVLIQDTLSFQLGLDGQTTPFDATGLPQFDNEILEIVPGFRGKHFDDFLNWHVYISEDIIPESTVDFTLGFSLGFKI